MTPSRDTMLEFQRRMLRIRLFDERAAKMLMRGQIPGTIHTSIGQEAQVVGACMALRDTYARIQPFVATLATMSACSGLALFITDGSPITGFPDWYTSLTSIQMLGIPFEAIILVVMRFWPSGRALYAVGGNEEVARLSGLNVQRIRVGVYAAAGFLAALAGVVVGSRLDSAQPTAGVNDLLSVIAVVVIGGASLAGGAGSMLGTFIGLLTIGVLRNGMGASQRLAQPATRGDRRRHHLCGPDGPPHALLRGGNWDRETFADP